jgi:glutamate---cysteine ligase / carboxylate-amine ligase
MSEPAAGLRLFEGVGIEIEYMIVDADGLQPRPIADQVLEGEQEVELGDMAWSNELALHVIELKNNGPAADLRGLADRFHEHSLQIEQRLADHGARLMPTAMHPWMDPTRELRLWPHGNDAVYRAFDRIFGCTGHGWANLQSMHVNLPFAGDDEFGRLHAAIRVALPIMPALAASSPLVEGRVTGLCDSRLAVYRDNSRQVPSITGAVVPEAVFSRAEYAAEILGRIYADLEPLDPEAILRHEWVNARGCIARFDRSAIEIRVLDVQECPRADIAIAGAVTAVVQGLVEERYAGQRQLRSWHEQRLADILQATVRAGDQAVLRDRDYLELFGFPERPPCRAGELWQHLIEDRVAKSAGYDEWASALDVIMRLGCLARRIARAAGTAPSRDQLRELYRQLCDSLRTNQPFAGHEL